MTKFQQDDLAVEIEDDEGETKANSGPAFLTDCKEQLQDTVEKCVADYDDESVEDFADIITNAIWAIQRDALVKSFINGKRSRSKSRRRY